MQAGKYAKFRAWYDSNRFTRFNLPEQLRLYGQNDVDLLLHALVEYRKLVRKISDAEFDDVYYHCTTLAGTTLRDIRMKHLEESTIAIIPRRGYSRQETQSRIALKFLKWLAHERGVQIQHRDHKGEKRIQLPDGKITRVDGYIESINEMPASIIEIHGCYW